ncbi:MAG TPA: peroxiredoxin [Bacteroidales bacterium]|nr:peroxiredoxin [Bacteroidales bacterium]HRZ49546.1 peroxiredoxin [Bacteroidales bacterium]
MKRITLFILMVVVALQTANAQQVKNPCGPLTSGPAPAFTAVSTLGTLSFPDDYFGEWKIIFSHPADFTPVCTSEIMALAQAQEDFEKLSTQLIVVSTDGLNSHIEWVKSIESIISTGSDSIRIKFPLVADPDLIISRLYGLLNPDSASRNDIRGVYFIDPENQIRAFFHYPVSVGRNIEEIKRTLIALQTEEQHDVYLPANWQPGEEVLVKSPATVKEAEKMKNKKGLREVTWYMWFKKL